MTHKLLLLPGDGIGPEVVGEARRIVDWFSARGVSFEIEEDLVGGCAYEAHGEAVSDATMKLAEASDAVLLGAVGGPQWDGGAVPYDKRPEAGLLGGMLEVPSTRWDDLMPPEKDALRAAPLKADWWKMPGTVSHTFTHFKLELLVYRTLVPPSASLTFWAEPDRCRWVARRDLGSSALPSVMRKVIAHGLRDN